MEEGGIVTEQAKAPEQPKETRAELKAQLKAIADKLNRQEGQRHSGARERLPKSRMLDARALEEKDKEHHYRYENTDDAGRMQVMMDEGYVSVPEDECEQAGVRAQVGELRLIRVPQEIHEETVARQKELAKSRLEAHKVEMRTAAETIVRELRDKHGVDISVDRFLVDE